MVAMTWILQNKEETISLLVNSLLTVVWRLRPCGASVQFFLLQPSLLLPNYPINAFEGLLIYILANTEHTLDTLWKTVMEVLANERVTRICTKNGKVSKINKEIEKSY